jgi:hypothetical protein
MKKKYEDNKLHLEPYPSRIKFKSKIHYHDEGLTFAIIMVLEFPPSESCERGSK